MPRPKGVKRIRLTFTIDRQYATRIREISDETGIPMSRLIEDCIKALSAIHQPTQIDTHDTDPLGPELIARLRSLGVDLGDLEEAPL